MLSLKLEKKLGEGSFGIVYRIAIESTKYAIKIEKKKGAMKNEIATLKSLSHSSIPVLVSSGIYHNHTFIVIPLYKISMLQILTTNRSFFNSKTVSAIAWNLVNVLEYIHSKDIIYRDMKPENVMLGFDNRIYLVDFGLCECRRVPVSDTHHTADSNKRTGDKNTHHKRITDKNTHDKRINGRDVTAVKMVGTPRYASLSAHKGIPLSPSDDLESLLYVLIFLLKSTLPWIDVTDIKKIQEIKESVDVVDFLRMTEWNEFIRLVKERKANYRAMKESLIGILNGDRRGIMKWLCFSCSTAC